jgi:hypothetical protein
VPKVGKFRNASMIGSQAGRLAALLLALAMPASLSAQSTLNPEPAVVLRGLDKVTARITTFSVEPNGDAEFGTLRIIARACRKRPPEEPPEVAAFLEIEESRPGDDIPKLLFSGWMFASSPALSALEHPVYDVWVIDCKTSKDDKSAPSKAKSAN